MNLVEVEDEREVFSAGERRLLWFVPACVGMNVREVEAHGVVLVDEGGLACAGVGFVHRIVRIASLRSPGISRPLI